MIPTTATQILNLLRVRKMTARALKLQIPSKSFEAVRTCLRDMALQGLVEKIGQYPATYQATALGASMPPKYHKTDPSRRGRKAEPKIYQEQKRHPIAAKRGAMDEDGFPVFEGDAVVAFAVRRAPNSVFALGAR